MDREPFHITKEEDYRNLFSVVNHENDKRETDTVFKKDLSDPLNVSLASSASCDFPTDCYYCDHKSTGSKSEYEKHVVNLHSGKPGYPGLADIERYGLEPKGFWWER